jgi:hypothetical protein
MASNEQTPGSPATREEDKPVGPKDRSDVADLVHSDIESRAEIGREKYGERLSIFNGRDALVDAYQEALDLVMYLRQRIEERNQSEPPTSN